jgi:hypothetical protein
VQVLSTIDEFGMVKVVCEGLSADLASHL